MNFYIHTLRLNTSVAAVLPKEASFFATKCHIFRFAELNAFTTKHRSEKIKYLLFLWWKVSWHFMSTIFIFTQCCEIYVGPFI